MRLDPTEIAAIKDIAARHFGADAGIWLFGSRLDDQRRGGDIDLLVESRLPDAGAVVQAEIGFLADIKQRIGERKIDVLVDFPSRSLRPPVFRVAREQGVRL